MASNAPSALPASPPTSTRQRRSPASALVDAVATSEDVERSKPSPDSVEGALDKLKPATSERCLFVGDTPWDAEAAKRAGVIAIGIGQPNVQRR
jgi:HAD superfamily hydrolase (TIGR01509 family)